MFKLFKRAAVETVDPETALRVKIAKGEAAILDDLGLTTEQEDFLCTLAIIKVVKIERDVFNSRSIITAPEWRDFFEKLFIPRKSLAEIVDDAKRAFPNRNPKRECSLT